MPEVAIPVAIERLEGQRFESTGAVVFLFAPFITQLNFDTVIKEAKLPESKSLSASSRTSVTNQFSRNTGLAPGAKG